MRGNYSASCRKPWIQWINQQRISQVWAVNPQKQHQEDQRNTWWGSSRGKFSWRVVDTLLLKWLSPKQMQPFIDVYNWGGSIQPPFLQFEILLFLRVLIQSFGKLKLSRIILNHNALGVIIDLKIRALIKTRNYLDKSRPWSLLGAIVITQTKFQAQVKAFQTVKELHNTLHNIQSSSRLWEASS